MAKKAAKKKTPAKKSAVKKKAPAKKAAPQKKAPANKAASKKKAPAKKAAPKKKAAVKRAPVKKSTPKKKAPAKKVAPKKAAPAKKPAPKKAAVGKPAPKKASVKKTTPKKEAAPKKSAPKAAAAKKETKPVPIRKRIVVKRPAALSVLNRSRPVAAASKARPRKPLSAAFLKKQRQNLLDLRDTLVDQMNGVARDTLGRGEENHEASAFGMHQADAGSDAYDRDFALNILSQEQNAIHEIEEALIRIDNGEYGICEGSGEPIPIARLEAMPFARCTVEFQEKLDQEQAVGHYRSPVGDLFGADEKEVATPIDK